MKTNQDCIGRIVWGGDIGTGMGKEEDQRE